MTAIDNSVGMYIRYGGRYIDFANADGLAPATLVDEPVNSYFKVANYDANSFVIYAYVFCEKSGRVVSMCLNFASTLLLVDQNVEFYDIAKFKILKSPTLANTYAIQMYDNDFLTWNATEFVASPTPDYSFSVETFPIDHIKTGYYRILFKNLDDDTPPDYLKVNGETVFFVMWNSLRDRYMLMDSTRKLFVVNLNQFATNFFGNYFQLELNHEEKDAEGTDWFSIQLAMPSGSKNYYTIQTPQVEMPVATVSSDIPTAQNFTTFETLFSFQSVLYNQ